MNAKRNRDKKLGNGWSHMCLALLVASIINISVTATAVDQMILKSGTTVECSVVSYADGKITVRLPDGKTHDGLIEEISKINFELGMGEADDEIQLNNGSVVSCAMVSYEDGVLSVRLPNGDKQSGNISEIKAMKIVPAVAKPSFESLANPPAVQEPTPATNHSKPSHVLTDSEVITISGYAEDVPRLQFDVTRAKQENRQNPGAYYVYKNDMVTMDVKIKNTDFSRSLEPGNGYVFTILRNLANRKQYKVLNRESFDVPALGPGEDFQWQGDAAMGETYRDNGYYPHGFEYNGWLCFVLDSENRIVAVASSKEGWQKNPEKAANLKVDDVFDHSFTVFPPGLY